MPVKEVLALITQTTEPTKSISNEVYAVNGLCYGYMDLLHLRMYLIVSVLK